MPERMRATEQIDRVAVLAVSLAQAAEFYCKYRDLRLAGTEGFFFTAEVQGALALLSIADQIAAVVHPDNDAKETPCPTG